MDPDQRLAEALARAAIEEYAAMGDPFAIRHRVQVTSLGGSGTTSLTEVFIEAGLDLPPGPAQWPHKHLRRPPATDDVPPGFRVVYPVGDPRDAVLSVFRRGIQVGHWKGLHVGPEGVGEPPASLATLESFLAAGVDEFDLAGHLDGWYDHPSGYPVMFVRFDHIEEAWEEVAAFVDLPPTVAPIRYEARHSDWRSQPPAIREPLDRLYGDLAARIDSFPAVQIR